MGDLLTVCRSGIKSVNLQETFLCLSLFRIRRRPTITAHPDRSIRDRHLHCDDVDLHPTAATIKREIEYTSVNVTFSWRPGYWS